MNKRYVAVERFYRSKILAQMTILITFFFSKLNQLLHIV